MRVSLVAAVGAAAIAFTVGLSTLVGSPEPVPASTDSAHETRIEKLPIGESLPTWVDSGPHDGSPGETVLAHSEVIDHPSAPWIRLHLQDVVLGANDSIEIVSPNASQNIDSEDVHSGRVATAYLTGSSVTLNLWVGPGAQGSRFVVSAIEVGFPPNGEEKICDADDRGLSEDERVCLLRFQQQVCTTNTAILCGCPGGTCTSGACVGGTRAGLGCGNTHCGAGTCTAPVTFSGTAFFVEGCSSQKPCLLTSGHNFYSIDENHLQTGNASTILHCQVYGCGTGSCDNVVGGAGTCTGGPRPGAPCTPGTTAAPAQQFAVTLVDGEVQAGGNPHDWALFSSPRVGSPVFWLRMTGTPTLASVTGHGADSDTPANSKFQQSDIDFASRAGDVLTHTVDTEGGNSGSPIIDFFDDKAWGIHNGGPGGCSSPATNPNFGVWVGHAHGAPGRSLRAALVKIKALKIPAVGVWGTIGLIAVLLGVATVHGRRTRGIRA